MDVIKDAYYEFKDSRVARILGISPYFSEAIIFAHIYDSKGKLIECKDYWINDFKQLIHRRVQPKKSCLDKAMSLQRYQEARERYNEP